MIEKYASPDLTLKNEWSSVMKLINRTFIVLLVLFGVVLSQQDTVRVCTYNILNFPGNNANARKPFFRTITKTMKADVLVVQEMQSQTGVNFFANQVLNGQYHSVAFHDGPDTDNALFYRTTDFSFLSAHYFSTNLRDIADYVLRHNLSGEELHIYSLHLKASQGSTNEQERLAEVGILKNHLLSLPQETNYIVLGDFNIYTSLESAFQHLTADGTCLDPINASGNWHNNSSFSAIHTQSPRLDSFGGGSSGGLDDRFDMMLISDDLLDNVISTTYHAYGNDGFHFNQSVNSGVNYAVPDSVANALYYASDHLPVVCDFVFSVPTALGDKSHQAAEKPQLFQNFPNPFNPSTTIRIYIPAGQKVSVKVYDLLGQKVGSVFNGYIAAGFHQFTWRPEASLASGVYFLKLSGKDMELKRKMQLLR